MAADEMGEEEASGRGRGMSPILTLDLGDRNHWDHAGFITIL